MSSFQEDTTIVPLPGKSDRNRRHTAGETANTGAGVGKRSLDVWYFRAALAELNAEIRVLRRSHGNDHVELARIDRQPLHRQALKPVRMMIDRARRYAGANWAHPH